MECVVAVESAEGALDAARSTGQSHRFHDSDSNRTNRERLELHSLLLSALQRSEFSLHYQLKMDCRELRPCGAEALLRWENSALGAVAPSRFVPVLEGTGLIGAVGECALRRAALDRVQHIQAIHPGFRIAVNVSAAQLLAPNFVETVQRALGEHLLAVAQIDLELTESLVMTDIAGSIDKLHQLREQGVKIAVDDFGAGYSSLIYLAKLPVDYLKIDQAFVKGLPQDRESVTIISSIIGLGHALGLQVIAEGVETQAQADLLVALGCDQIQGYYFAKPQPLGGSCNGYRNSECYKRIANFLGAAPFVRDWPSAHAHAGYVATCRSAQAQVVSNGFLIGRVEGKGIRMSQRRPPMQACSRRAGCAGVRRSCSGPGRFRVRPASW